MVTRIVRQHPLICFFSLAYIVTWVLEFPAAILPNWPELLTFLGSFGPVIAAFLVAGLSGGPEAVQKLMAPIKTWRVGVKWYLVVLLGPTLMMISAIFLYSLLHKGSSGIPNSLRVLPMVGNHLLALIAIFIYQIMIVWGEEIGWRGYALPRLQTKHPPILASIILGILWGFWHLPLFWIEGSVHQSMTVQFFVLTTVGYTILYTWIYNGTHGSLLLMCLLHAANNTTVSYTMLFFKPILEEPLFSLAVLGLFDLLVILIVGPNLLWRPPIGNEGLKVTHPQV